MSKFSNKKRDHIDDPDETADLPTLSVSANDPDHRATVTHLESHLVAEQLKQVVRLIETMNSTVEQIAISLKPRRPVAPKSVRKKKKKTTTRKKAPRKAKK